MRNNYGWVGPTRTWPELDLTQYIKIWVFNRIGFFIWEIGVGLRSGQARARADPLLLPFLLPCQFFPHFIRRFLWSREEPKVVEQIFFFFPAIRLFTLELIKSWVIFLWLTTDKIRFTHSLITITLHFLGHDIV